VEAVRGLGLPEFATRYLAAAAASLPSLPPAATVGEAVATLLASSIIGILSFVALFFLTQLVFVLLGWLVSGLISATGSRGGLHRRPPYPGRRWAQSLGDTAGLFLHEPCA